MDRAAEFERIEAIAMDAARLRDLSLREVRKLRDSLLSSAPLSTNPKFIERVRRVETALNARLSEKPWWQKPLGIVFLSVVAAFLAAAVLRLLGWR